MAMAVKTFNLQFPRFKEQEEPYLKAEGFIMYCCNHPVAYDLVLEPEQNFLISYRREHGREKHADQGARLFGFPWRISAWVFLQSKWN
jgi:hypothetical protein